MRVVVGRPPNYEKIVAVFPMAARNDVLFTYGQTLYVGPDVRVTEALMAHEEVHAQRQGDMIEEWWDKYLTDPLFRFKEELVAHAAEYKYHIDQAQNRQQRRRAEAHLKAIAFRLAGPLYGNMISAKAARKEIETCAGLL